MRLLAAAQKKGIAEKKGRSPPAPPPRGRRPYTTSDQVGSISMFLNLCSLFLLPPSLPTTKRYTGHNRHDSITRSSSQSRLFFHSPHEVHHHQEEHHVAHHVLREASLQ